MDDTNFNEALLNDILERGELISEKKTEQQIHQKKTKKKARSRKRKQSKEERHAKHKEWRKKNPQKVRKQVADHQKKTDQNKNREDTRLQKEKGEIPEDPSCSKCGSKDNVQYDHQKGYAKGAPTVALCHKHHTDRPQQNQEGEKSVKGGTKKGRITKMPSPLSTLAPSTLAASYDRQEIPLLEGNLAQQRDSRRNAKHHARHVPRKTKEDDEEPGIKMYPHPQNSRIKVKYASHGVISDFDQANMEHYNPTNSVAIKIVDTHREWEEQAQAIKDKREIDARYLEGTPALDISQPDEPIGPAWAGARLTGHITNANQTTSTPGDSSGGGRRRPPWPSSFLAPPGSTPDIPAEDDDLPDPIWFKITGGSIPPELIGHDIKLTTKGPDRHLAPFDDGSLVKVMDKPDDEYLGKVAEHLDTYGYSSMKHDIMPKGWDQDAEDQEWEESPEDYQKRIRPFILRAQDLYHSKTGTGRYVALERDGKEWLWLFEPEKDMSRIDMAVPVELYHPYDTLDIAGGRLALDRQYTVEFRNEGEKWQTKKMSGPVDPKKAEEFFNDISIKYDVEISKVKGDDDLLRIKLKDPETGKLINNGEGVPGKPKEFDATGVKLPIALLAARRNQEYLGFQDPDLKILDPDDEWNTENILPPPRYWSKKFAYWKVNAKGYNPQAIWDGMVIKKQMEIYHPRISKEDGSIEMISGRAFDQIVQEMAIESVGAEKWREWSNIMLRSGYGHECGKCMREVNGIPRARFDEQGKLADGSTCDRCGGTGSRIKGNALAQSPMKSKKLELARAKHKLLKALRTEQTSGRKWTKHRYAKRLEKAKLDLASLMSYRAAISPTMGGYDCEVCGGKGKIQIDRAAELKDLGRQIRKLQNLEDLKIDVLGPGVQEEMFEARKRMSEISARAEGAASQDPEWIALSDRIRGLKKQFKEFKDQENGWLKILTRDRAALQQHPTGEPVFEPCLMCAGTGKPGQRKEQRVRGDKTIDVDIQQLNDAISKAFDKDCDVCWDPDKGKSTGYSDERSIHIEIIGEKQLNKVARYIIELHNNQEIKNPKWDGEGPAYISEYEKIATQWLKYAKKRRGDNPAKELDAAINNVDEARQALNKVREEEDVDVPGGRTPAAVRARELNERIEYWQKEIQKITRYKGVQDDLAKIEEFKAAIQKEPGKILEPPRFSNKLISLEIVNSFYGKKRLLLDAAIDVELAKEIVNNIRAHGAKAWVEKVKCDSCDGGSLSRHISDGIFGIWAQSFNRMVQDSIPWQARNLFLKKILESTRKYEEGVRFLVDRDILRDEEIQLIDSLEAGNFVALHYDNQDPPRILSIARTPPKGKRRGHYLEGKWDRCEKRRGDYGLVEVAYLLGALSTVKGKAGKSYKVVHTQGELCSKCDGEGTLENGSNCGSCKGAGLRDKKEWGFRQDDRQPGRTNRYLKLSDLVDDVNGTGSVKCRECHQGIRTKGKGDEGADAEKFHYPRGRKIKLSSEEKEKIADGHGRITIEQDGKIYSYCTTCSGKGSLANETPRDLKEDPIYIERRDDPYEHYLAELRRVFNSLPERKKEGAYSAADESLKTKPEEYLEKRYPDLYRMLKTNGKLEGFVNEYQGRPDELVPAIMKMMEEDINEPRALKNKGVLRVVKVEAKHFQEYGSGGLQQRAEKLASEATGGADWDNLVVHQDEIDRLIDKYNVSRPYILGQTPEESGETTSWDSMDMEGRARWERQARLVKQRKFKALAKARDLAARYHSWDRAVTERNFLALPQVRQRYWENQAALGGNLGIGDDEDQQPEGTVRITYEDINSGEEAVISYRAEFNPILLQVFLISDLREDDEELDKRMKPGPSQRPRDRRAAQQRRGPHGKKGRGRKPNPEGSSRGEDAKEPGAPAEIGLSRFERRAAATAKKKAQQEPKRESIDRPMLAILESLDRDINNEQSIDPEHIARLLEG